MSTFSFVSKCHGVEIEHENFRRWKTVTLCYYCVLYMCALHYSSWDAVKGVVKVNFALL